MSTQPLTRMREIEVANPVDTSNNANIQYYKDKFEQDGFIVARKVIDDQLVRAAYTLQDALLQELFKVLHEKGHIERPEPFWLDDTEKISYPMGRGVKYGFREVVMRSPGRYEVSLTGAATDILLKVDASSSGLSPVKIVTENSFLSFVPSLLGASSWEQVKILNASIVCSTPGASAQTWHADGGHVKLQTHETCHCLNICIPLVTVVPELGPTELRPGSQFLTRNLAPMMLAAKARRTLRSPEAPLLDIGDALIFDYRILHRGLANTTLTEKRPFFVVTVSATWFKDGVNFPSRSIND